MSPPRSTHGARAAAGYGTTPSENRQQLLLAVAGVALVLQILAAIPGAVEGSVMGIDYGSDFVKVAAPRGADVKVDIVLNEQSRRKVDNLIGFRGEERYFGEDAKNLAARFPLNAVNMVNVLAGLEHGTQPYRDLARQQYLYNIVAHPTRNTLNVSIGQDGKVFYSSEELMAMQLMYFRRMTKNDGFPDPKSAVITIPFHSTIGERQAIVDAAAIAGINVLGFLHSTTAAALYYGVRRRGFENRTVNLVIFDLGSTHTEVGVYTFTPPNATGLRKVKLADSFGTLATRAVVRDPTLGGRAFDVCIADILLKEAMEKMKIKDVRDAVTVPEKRAKFSLLRAANRAREVLSANSQTPVSVEAIAPDRDFHTTMTRKTFEEVCAPLFARVKGVAERALDDSGLAQSDVTAFELMGGAVRMPKVIADLSAYLGRDVDRTMNMDEAAAIGAAYYAIRLSKNYRVRSFSLQEFVPISMGFKVLPQETDKPAALRMLFSRPSIGKRSSITLHRINDFSLTLFAVDEATGSPSGSPFARINVTGVKDTLERLDFFSPSIAHPNHSHMIRIQLRVAETGLVEVEEAEVIVNYAVNVSKRVKVNASSRKDSPNGASDPVEPEEQQSVESTEQFVTEHVLKMKQKSATLKTRLVITSPPPFSKEELEESRARVAAIQQKEDTNRATAMAKNNLEAYILWAKMEGIVENSELRAAGVLSEAEAGSILEKLTVMQEWLEDGEGSTDECTKETYEAKLAELKNQTSGPIKALEKKLAATKNADKGANASSANSSTKSDADTPTVHEVDSGSDNTNDPKDYEEVEDAVMGEPADADGLETRHKPTNGEDLANSENAEDLEDL